MKLIICFLGLMISIGTFAMGGEWYAEINYKYEGVKQHGYIRVDFWADAFIENDSGFVETFHEYFDDQFTIPVYQKIVDRSTIADTVKFPMHPFELNAQNYKSQNTGLMKNIELVKVWKRIAYYINVISPIKQSDIPWMTGKPKVSYPVGDDVGCRIEAYIFNSPKGYDSLLDEFAKLYLKKEEDLNRGEKLRKTELIDLLYQKKIVLVELCGC